MEDVRAQLGTTMESLLRACEAVVKEKLELEAELERVKERMETMKECWNSAYEDVFHGYQTRMVSQERLEAEIGKLRRELVEVAAAKPPSPSPSSSSKASCNCFHEKRLLEAQIKKLQSDVVVERITASGLKKLFMMEKEMHVMTKLAHMKWRREVGGGEEDADLPTSLDVEMRLLKDKLNKIQQGDERPYMEPLRHMVAENIRLKTKCDKWLSLYGNDVDGAMHSDLCEKEM